MSDIIEMPEPTNEELYQQMRDDLESGECCSISDKGEVMLNGKRIATMTGDNRDDVFALIRHRFKTEGYWPNIYEINDHGNVTLLDSNDNHVASWV